MSSPAVRRSLIAAALVLILVFTALPPLFGTVAEGAYQESLRQTTAALPPGWGLTERYERGWFDSHATAELTPPPLSGIRGRIRHQSRIAHGPWSWFGPGPWPALSRIHTRAEWVDGDFAVPPLFLDTVIAAGGVGETRIRVPAGSAPTPARGLGLENAEITALLRFRKDTREVLIDLDVPRLVLLDPAGPVLGLDGARLAGQLTGWTAGRYSGQANLTVDAAEAGLPTPGTTAAPTRIEGLRLAIDQTATGAPMGSRLDLRLSGTADRLRIAGIENRSATLGFTVESLDIRALNELAKAVRTAASDQVPPALRGLAGVGIATQAVPGFLASRPRLVLDPVTLVTPQGPASARLSLAANGQALVTNGAGALLGALLSRGPNGLLQGIDGDAAVDLPEPLARAWLAAAGAPDPLTGWVQDGWVTQSNGRVTSQVRLADGQLSINGRPLALRLPGLGR